MFVCRNINIVRTLLYMYWYWLVVLMPKRASVSKTHVCNIRGYLD